MVKTESYKENLLESLKDPEAAAEYLTACLDDGDVEVFLLALRDVAIYTVCCQDRATLRLPAWTRY
jgi:DNA-binding phage protein